MSLPIPMWLLYLVMPLGFLLVCLRLVQCTVKIAGQIRQGELRRTKLRKKRGSVMSVAVLFVLFLGLAFLGSTHWLCHRHWGIGLCFLQAISYPCPIFVRAMANSVDSFTLTAVPLFLCWQDRLCQRQESQKVLF